MKYSEIPFSKTIHTYSNRLTSLIRLYVCGCINSEKFLQLKEDIFNQIVQDRKDGIYEITSERFEKSRLLH